MKRKTPLVILSNIMETTCPELQTHAPLTCFFVLLPWKLGLSSWFPSLSHPCLSGDFGRKSASQFILIIWCIYVFTAFSSLLFNHLSLTYSFHLSGNIYWAPVMFVAWSRHEEGRNNRRQILAVSWPSSHSPGNVSSGILCSLSIRCYQRGKCHKPGAAFPECIREKILTISSSTRGLFVSLHIQLNVNCSLEAFFSWDLIHSDSAQPRGCLHPSVVEKVSHLAAS